MTKMKSLRILAGAAALGTVMAGLTGAAPASAAQEPGSAVSTAGSVTQCPWNKFIVVWGTAGVYDIEAGYKDTGRRVHYGQVLQANVDGPRTNNWTGIWRADNGHTLAVKTDAVRVWCGQ